MSEQKKAWSLENAAKVYSIGEDKIRYALENGDLVRRFPPPSTRGIFWEEDMNAWMRSLPTEPPTS